MQVNQMGAPNLHLFSSQKHTVQTEPGEDEVEPEDRPHEQPELARDSLKRKGARCEEIDEQRKGKRTEEGQPAFAGR